MAKKDQDEDLIENEEDDVEDPDADGESDGESDGDSGKKPKKDEEDSIEVAIEEDDDKDERISVKKNKDYSEETLEEKRSRRRDEKKKKRHQDYLNRQNLRKYETENSELKKRLEALETLAPQFKQRADAQDEAQLDSAISSQVNLYKNAESHLEKAITEGNGAAAKEAQRIMFDANNKYTQLQGLKQKYKETAAQEIETAKAPKNSQPSQAQLVYMNRWISKNDWFDPDKNTRDKDSKKAREIDNEVALEFDPNTKEYWDELEERIKEELPHVFEEKRPRNIKPRPKQVNGSIGADSTSSSAKTIKIPASVMKMAEDQGFLSDPKMKKIFLRNYAEQQKNMKAN